ncbi:uncharacterized protein BO97DRAFT_477902 [Aspergillus homomorphus CBS 101889]|uniref:Uncharacterized protein n=1 Tax=Aspergillus homomorphus (strain CBS 101889) TaxID=1450537 RepID=A0A395HYW0_ASPHC|nr:hypothetical protein BO97DRAFT_477902 [Aspergillus homomorphus CBS 101889]RAL12573.1 hypothetical protein BO97DRAFT_477902 [Aspergillus homomorphus CBS 101889]
MYQQNRVLGSTVPSGGNSLESPAGQSENSAIPARSFAHYISSPQLNTSTYSHILRGPMTERTASDIRTAIYLSATTLRPLPATDVSSESVCPSRNSVPAATNPTKRGRGRKQDNDDDDDNDDVGYLLYPEPARPLRGSEPSLGRIDREGEVEENGEALFAIATSAAMPVSLSPTHPPPSGSQEGPLVAVEPLGKENVTMVRVAGQSQSYLAPSKRMQPGRQPDFASR